VGVEQPSFTDTRDGKIYKTTKIGEQVWMAENLNYEAEGSRCYNDSISYCDKYGRLYEWETAMESCPKGWHLPSNAEWDELYRHMDGDKGTESPYKSKTAGKYLKATSGWVWNNYDDISGNGEDRLGFSALPGGYGNSDGDFYYVGNKVYWWSNSSEYSSDDAYHRGMIYSSEYAYWDNIDKSRLYSVRCVQD
jgi:uncharacterized protein (TIGR02145 family)